MTNKATKIIIYIFLIISAIIFFFPFYFLIVSATNTSAAVTSGSLLFGGELFNNLRKMVENTRVIQAMINSLFIAVVQTFISVLLSSMAGYGFSIHKTKGKDFVYKIILLSMMIPFASLMVPLFQIFGSISKVAPAIGIDTFWGVMLPYLATAFLIFYFRQSSSAFPKDLLDAGRIDGLSEIGLFFKVYMPTMKSTYASAIIVTFMTSWNNYMWPLVVLQSSEKFTVPLVVSALGSGYTPDYGVIMASILVTTIPIAIIFFSLQKNFVAGFTGSVKG